MKSFEFLRLIYFQLQQNDNHGLKEEKRLFYV